MQQLLFTFQRKPCSPPTERSQAFPEAFPCHLQRSCPSPRPNLTFARIHRPGATLAVGDKLLAAHRQKLHATLPRGHLKTRNLLPPHPTQKKAAQKIRPVTKRN